MPNTIQPPASWPSIINGHTAQIGVDATTNEPFELNLNNNTYVWSTERGAGMTNLLRMVIAAATAQPGNVVFVIDPSRHITQVEPMLRPWLTGTLKNVHPDPVVDWYAPDLTEAGYMLHSLAHMAEDRQDMMHATQVLVIIAAGTSGLYNTGDATGQTRMIEEHVAAIANTSAGITFLIAGTKPPAQAIPSDLNKNLDQILLVGDAPDHEIVGAFGKTTADRGRVQKWHGLYAAADSRAGRSVQFYLFTNNRAADVVRRGQLDWESRNNFYFGRWLRVLPTLTDDGQIPPHLSRYGMPVVAGEPRQMPTHALAWALRCSPSVNSPTTEAAVSMLIEICDGELLRCDGVLKALYVQDGELYIRWPAIYQTGRDIELGNASCKHPDAPVVLRIASHMATGGFTHDTLDHLVTIIDAMQEHQ
jgi:hypothetical protein